LVIPNGETDPFLVDESAIDVLAAQLSRIERAVRDVLVYAPGPNLNEETIEMRFKALEDAVLAARSVTVKLTGVAAIAMAGHLSAHPEMRRDSALNKNGEG
jgi:hypothetical protein